ncbi:aldo/keto reductase [Chelatococcus sp. GCM10030263]|uniref:aldo/keto reductase n=1 Tax=Chelatococcus sp. GCM10030263 TaxID=3273387 RepID=UPI00361F3714
MQRRQIAQTTLAMPVLGFGGATLGDAGGSIPEYQALSTIEAAYAAGIDYFDTSPWYGNGKSELRFGAVLRAKPRASYSLSTKVGRVYQRCTDPDHPSQQRWRGGLPFSPTFDYTRDGVLRSYEQSLLRLGIDRIDALLIHDLDESHLGSPAAVEARLDELDAGGGFAALAALKAAGEIAAIGAGINRLGMIPKFLDRFSIDFFLVAMPYTLLNQEALDAELPLCQARGASVVIGAPFASGILAIGPVAGATYGYQPAPDPVLQKARAIKEIGERHGVPLGAAALQFPLAHPAVAAVIPGPVNADQLRANLKWMRHPIPAAFWQELKAAGLLRADAPVPEGPG